VNYLLDTHTYLWFANGDKLLPNPVKEIILDTRQPCFLSIASLWEITIKKQLGKLEVNQSLEFLFKGAERNQIEIIHFSFDHLYILSTLPRIHRDPFDRAIISQAISENLTILTKDKDFHSYEVNIKW
jgi:PIN domain nuclease of toxin-antitoxin system